MIDEAAIGAKIKMLRLQRGLNLQDLAKAAGFSKGYLSKVENSDKAPPVSTLINLAKALAVNISAFFDEEEEKTTITLVKKNELKTMARDGSQFGYSYEPLAHTYHGRHMDPYILTLPVKPKRKRIFQHKGEEILVVMEGTMLFKHGGKEFLVEEGDCIYFDSNVPHYGIAVSSKPVKCLMIIYSEE